MGIEDTTSNSYKIRFQGKHWRFAELEHLVLRLLQPWQPVVDLENQLPSNEEGQKVQIF
jgi:hypothetical protein